MSVVSERINPGIYYIENFVSKNSVDVEGLAQPLICQRGGKGQWQIVPDGPGYSISLLRQDTLSEYPSVISQPDNRGSFPVVASQFRTTWRIVRETGNPDYFRIFWRDSDYVWDLADYGRGEIVHYKENSPDPDQPCRLWKFVPVHVP